MTPIAPTLSLLSLLAFSPGCRTPTPSNPNPKFQSAQPPILNEAFKDELQAFTPGPAITELQTLTGQWNVTLTLLAWPNQDVIVPATIATGTAQVRSALGGRFIEWDTELDWTGAPVASRTCLGFDETTERYELWWSSTVSSRQRMARGRGKLRGSGITLERLEPTGEEILRLRTVLRATDADHFELMELGFDPESASWMPRSVTRYSRSTNAEWNGGQGWRASRPSTLTPR